MPLDWRDIAGAPKDGTRIWGWLSDEGIHLLRWGDAAEWALRNGGTPDEYISCWVKVCDEDDGDWSPRFWLPVEALPAPQSCASGRWRDELPAHT